MRNVSHVNVAVETCCTRCDKIIPIGERAAWVRDEKFSKFLCMICAPTEPIPRSAYLIATMRNIGTPFPQIVDVRMHSQPPGSVACKYAKGEFPVLIAEGHGADCASAKRAVMAHLDAMPTAYQWTRAWLTRDYTNQGGAVQAYLTGAGTGANVLDERQNTDSEEIQRLEKEVETLKANRSEEPEVCAGCKGFLNDCLPDGEGDCPNFEPNVES